MPTPWSQNFLVDQNIARLCVQALDPQSTDDTLEIGPGKGVLTQFLLPKVHHLTAVEIDPTLSELLKRKYAASKNFSLLNKDFLELSQKELGFKRSFKIIGNLPYAVVSPIIQTFLSWQHWERAVIMVQKEVGERILAKPGSKNYGILSVSVQARSQIEKIILVSPSCFRPIPKVQSLVLRLKPLEKPLISNVDEKQFFEIVRGSFAQRRKKLINSLKYTTGLSSSKIQRALEASGLPTDTRAENLSPLDFKNLTKILRGAFTPSS